MGKRLKRLLLLVVILLLLGGALWWVVSYIAPDEQLDLSYAPIDVQGKALDMVKQLKPELVLSETDIDHLIKQNLKSEYGNGEAGSSAIMLRKDVRLDGARFELEANRLVAHMNVTYKERLPAALDAVYLLEWQTPNIVLRPQALSLKKSSLPLTMLDTIIIPLDLPALNVVTVGDVQFEQDRIRIGFKLHLSL
ncbi:hypothetical protein FHS16_003437 [Paenibacillus endophyticus]|uniref:Uncharacterized protein n=1 Tax=Paenibacillus endophyticus TaxID=1294268 RepID=A0A7W5C9W3_9BACL|nr:hypothetical protein [Paenibacillus endophyticus]MBB3153375.1 hypothetical protein [Paenibacillus endophyticus]